MACSRGETQSSGPPGKVERGLASRRAMASRVLRRCGWTQNHPATLDSPDPRDQPAEGMALILRYVCMWGVRADMFDAGRLGDGGGLGSRLKRGWCLRRNVLTYSGTPLSPPYDT